MPIPALVDATVLSNFAHIRRPDLLRLAFDRVITPQAVLDEVRAGEAVHRLPLTDWAWIEVVQLTENEKIDAEVLARSLGKGESGCLAVAASRGWLVLTDDRDARRAAAQRHVLVSGTLGALANLIEGHALGMNEANALLAEMIQHGFHSPVSNMQDVI